MKDAAILVPSRARSAQLGEMISAALSTSAAQTDIIVAVDNDDPDGPAYAALEDSLRGEKRVTWLRGPRDTMAGWTNKMAGWYAGGYFALGSFGDDHFPRTPGWDAVLLDALETPGVIMAYGDDLHQGRRLPTAPLIRSAVVTALGWMALPGCSHYFIDDGWLALADGAAAYCQNVIIEHVHPDAGKAPRDATYAEALPHWQADESIYRAWYAGRRHEDIRIAREAATG